MALLQKIRWVLNWITTSLTSDLICSVIKINWRPTLSFKIFCTILQRWINYKERLLFWILVFSSIFGTGMDKYGWQNGWSISWFRKKAPSSLVFLPDPLRLESGLTTHMVDVRCFCMITTHLLAFGSRLKLKQALNGRCLPHWTSRMASIS